MSWLKDLMSRSKPAYVVIYDIPRMYGTDEQYYGYFGSPEEARHLWEDFESGLRVKPTNVKLCRVIEHWSVETD